MDVALEEGCRREDVVYGDVASRLVGDADVRRDHHAGLVGIHVVDQLEFLALRPIHAGDRGEVQVAGSAFEQFQQGRQRLRRHRDAHAPGSLRLDRKIRHLVQHRIQRHVQVPTAQAIHGFQKVLRRDGQSVVVVS